ncbi:hypothetical protein LEMLEM_LOCUS9382 [Lemmus lemmus]
MVTLVLSYSLPVSGLDETGFFNWDPSGRNSLERPKPATPLSPKPQWVLPPSPSPSPLFRWIPPHLDAGGVTAPAPPCSFAWLGCLLLRVVLARARGRIRCLVTAFIRSLPGAVLLAVFAWSSPKRSCRPRVSTRGEEPKPDATVL